MKIQIKGRIGDPSRNNLCFFSPITQYFVLQIPQVLNCILTTQQLIMGSQIKKTKPINSRQASLKVTLDIIAECWVYFILQDRGVRLKRADQLLGELSVHPRTKRTRILCTPH